MHSSEYLRLQNEGMRLDMLPLRPGESLQDRRVLCRRLIEDLRLLTAREEEGVGMKLEVIGAITEKKEWTGEDGIRRAQITVSLGEHYPSVTLPWAPGRVEHKGMVKFTVEDMEG